MNSNIANDLFCFMLIGSVILLRYKMCFTARLGASSHIKHRVERNEVIELHDVHNS
jgi:hypothetical protein